jgi:hypothetical protein
LTYALNSGNASYSVTGYTGNTTDIIIPATYSGLPVTSIANNAFKWKSNITSVFIPSGVTSIGNSAFQYCSSLVSIEIPTGVTSISGSAFSGCGNLVIYARAESKPSGWASNWNDFRPVYWGISDYYEDGEGVKYVIEGGRAILTQAPANEHPFTQLLHESIAMKFHITGLI